MSGASIPLWAEWVVAVLLVSGTGLAFLGTIGLTRFRSFFDRMHAPTLCASMGMAAVVLASIVYFTVAGQRLVVHELLIAIFVTMTTPFTFTMLARAAYLRRLETDGDHFPPDARTPSRET